MDVNNEQNAVCRTDLPLNQLFCHHLNVFSSEHLTGDVLRCVTSTSPTIFCAANILKIQKNNMALFFRAVTLVAMVVLCACVSQTRAAGITSVRRNTNRYHQQSQEKFETATKRANLSVRCSEGAKRFADPNNEGKFYMCSYSSSHRIWMVYSFNCPAETVFDNRIQACGKKSNQVVKKPYSHGTRFQTRPKPGAGVNPQAIRQAIAAAKYPFRISTPRPIVNRNKLSRPNPFLITSARTTQPTTTTTPTTSTTTTTTTTTEPTTIMTSTLPPYTRAPGISDASDMIDEMSQEVDTKTDDAPMKQIGVIRKVASNIAYLAEVMEGLLGSLETFISECEEFVKEDYLDEILPNIFPPAVPSHKKKTSKLSSSSEATEETNNSSEDDLELNELNKAESTSIDAQSVGPTTIPENVIPPQQPQPSEWNIFLSTVKGSMPTTQPSVSSEITQDNPIMNVRVSNIIASPTSNNNDPQESFTQQTDGSKLSVDSLLPLLAKVTSAGGNRRPRINPIGSSDSF